MIPGIGQHQIGGGLTAQLAVSVEVGVQVPFARIEQGPPRGWQLIPCMEVLAI